MTDTSDKYVRPKNAVCLLMDFGGSMSVWDTVLTSVLYIAGNLMIFITVIICYILILAKTFQSSKKVGRHDDKSAIKILKRSFLISMSTIICWAPTFTFLIMSLLGISVNPSISAWLGIIVLPINSCLNPWLYTFLTKEYWPKIMELFNKK